MAAIVRVKRRINDDPADSLVLSCKRPRRGSDAGLPEPGDIEEVKNLFKFAATIKVEDESVSQAVRDAIRKEKLEKEYKLHSVNPDSIQARARAQIKSNNESGRYKLVSRRRALQLEDLDKGKEKDQVNVEEKLPFKPDDNKENEEAAPAQDKKIFFLYDVEQECKHHMQPISRPKHEASAITCNEVPMEREAVAAAPDGGEYVYDLYYLNQRDLDYGSLDYVMNIEAYNKDYEFDHYRSGDAYAEVYDDDDDSNDESNWRNDYPDEDPKLFDDEREPKFQSFGNDDDDELDQLDNIIDRTLHLGEAAFTGDLSSDEDDVKPPEFEFGSPLAAGIWGSITPSALPTADPWAAPLPTTTTISDTAAAADDPLSADITSDAVADDWVSKSLDSPFNPGNSAMWGSSLGAPWMADLEEEPAPDSQSHRLWAPSTDFETYKSRVLKSFSEQSSEPSSKT